MSENRKGVPKIVVGCGKGVETAVELDRTIDEFLQIVNESDQEFMTEIQRYTSTDKQLQEKVKQLQAEILQLSKKLANCTSKELMEELTTSLNLAKQELVAAKEALQKSAEESAIMKMRCEEIQAKNKESMEKILSNLELKRKRRESAGISDDLQSRQSQPTKIATNASLASQLSQARSDSPDPVNPNVSLLSQQKQSLQRESTVLRQSSNIMIPDPTGVVYQQVSAYWLLYYEANIRPVIERITSDNLWAGAQWSILGKSTVNQSSDAATNELQRYMDTAESTYDVKLIPTIEGSLLPTLRSWNQRIAYAAKVFSLVKRCLDYNGTTTDAENVLTLYSEFTQTDVQRLLLQALWAATSHVAMVFFVLPISARDFAGATFILPVVIKEGLQRQRSLAELFPEGARRDVMFACQEASLSSEKFAELFLATSEITSKKDLVAYKNYLTAWISTQLFLVATAPLRGETPDQFSLVYVGAIIISQGILGVLPLVPYAIYYDNTNDRFVLYIYDLYTFERETLTPNFPRSVRTAVNPADYFAFGKSDESIFEAAEYVSSLFGPYERNPTQQLYWLSKYTPTYLEMVTRMVASSMSRGISEVIKSKFPEVSDRLSRVPQTEAFPVTSTAKYFPLANVVAKPGVFLTYQQYERLRNKNCGKLPALFSLAYVAVPGGMSKVKGKLTDIQKRMLELGLPEKTYQKVKQMLSTMTPEQLQLLEIIADRIGKAKRN